MTQYSRIQTDFDFVIRRYYDVNDLSKEGLKSYLKKLLEDKMNLKDYSHGNDYCINSHVTEKLGHALDREITLVQFALSLIEKKKLARFDKWFSKNSEKHAVNNMKTVQRNNGKIDAWISVSDNISSKRVKLTIRNVNSDVDFMGNEYSINCCLRNDKSVKSKIHEYKQVADLYFQRCKYPRLSEVMNFEVLKKMLNVGEEQ